MPFGRRGKLFIKSCQIGEATVFLALLTVSISLCCGVLRFSGLTGDIDIFLKESIRVGLEAREIPKHKPASCQPRLSLTLLFGPTFSNRSPEAAATSLALDWLISLHWLPLRLLRQKSPANAVRQLL